MFKLVTSKTDLLKKVFAILDDLNHDLNIVVTERGIKIQSMDTSHVCLTNARFDKEFFSEYVFEKETVIGIKVSNILRVLECIGNEPVCLEYNDAESDEFIICSENAHFRMKTLDLDSEEMEVPDMDVDVVITADSSIIQKYFKNFSSFSDTVTFDTDEEHVRMTAKGDIGTAVMKLSDARVEITGKMKAEFALRYLITFSKAANISKTVVMKMLTGFPAMFEYEFDTNSFIKFYLAPKCSPDDEDD